MNSVELLGDVSEASPAFRSESHLSWRYMASLGGVPRRCAPPEWTVLRCESGFVLNPEA